MKQYRATRRFYYGEIDEFSPEDDFQIISEGEIIGELEESTALFIKDQVVSGVRLGSLQLQYLTLIGTTSDPPCGCDGLQGTQGPQGPGSGGAGSQGAQGPQGPGGGGSQGPQGPQGDAGSQGPQGPQGDAGSDGAQGPQGEQGPAGSQGSQGPQGLQGDEGALSTNTLILTAAGGWPSTTSGAQEPQKVEYTGNNVNLWLSDFDSSSQRFLEWTVPMPENWDAGQLTPRSFKWLADTTDTNSVVFGLQARSYGDGESVDQAWGAAEEVTDANQGQNVWNYSGAASGVTAAGTPAAGENLQFRAYRNPDDASDDLNATARLNSIIVEFGVT